ncbi:hypothetical protein F5J12DRAFT_905639 [Pisolithus orientalis]|uniref:uncharacterized protein n=1 Tax=Pisolithus orientalis TaxID=936130 RepID=UPI0022241DF5|nr:uncharacterized protein F5J12DRAFT_905639 [Pisolithus orientalis]KAI6006555.1 hypothetical protein F5J12DRAFT_905639 [Pisolithus orientalis]
MSPIELNHIADQLLVVLKDMRSYTSTMIGSVTGGPYNNRFMPYPRQPPHAFSSIQDSLPTEANAYLTHGDLLPQNILVEGSTSAGIIDWETAGYYPEFWEYCRMHDPGLMTPAWAHESASVYQILRYLRYNDVCFG